MPPHNSISEFYRQVLELHSRVSALTFTVNCGTLYRKVCFFLNHVQSIELVTGGLQSSCRDIWRMIKGNWMHLSSIWSVIAKVLKTYWCKTFQLFIFTPRHFGRRGYVVASVCPSIHFWLGCAITRHIFNLWAPNLHQLCILSTYRLLSKMGSIDLDLPGHSGL